MELSLYPFPGWTKVGQQFARFELPAPPDTDPKLGKKVVRTCHYCGEVGHKVRNCSKMSQELRNQQMYLWYVKAPFLIIFINLSLE